MPRYAPLAPMSPFEDKMGADVSKTKTLLLENYKNMFKNMHQNTAEKQSISKMIEELEERVRASDDTRAKLSKPYDSSTQRATKVKVKNAINDLDHIAWQFENQFDAGNGNKGKHLLMQKKVTQRVDSLMKDL